MAGISPPLTGLMLWILLSTPHQVDLLVCDRTNVSTIVLITEIASCGQYTEYFTQGYIIKTKDVEAMGMSLEPGMSPEDFIRQHMNDSCPYTLDRTIWALTCQNIGRSYYRTFDNVAYQFPGNSTYTLAESVDEEEGWQIEITLKNCDNLATCQKLIKVYIDNGDAVETDGSNIAVNGQNITVMSGKSVSTPQNSCKISVIDDFVEIACQPGLSVAVDVASTVCVTLNYIEIGGGKVRGLCGNNNGDPSILDEFIGAEDLETFGSQCEKRR